MEKPFLEELNTAFKVPRSKPRLYADVNEIMGESHYDYASHKLEYGYSSSFKRFKPVNRSMEPYEIKQKIGRGRYSEVFDGVNIYNGQRCVIKILKPGKPMLLHA